LGAGGSKIALTRSEKHPIDNRKLPSSELPSNTPLFIANPPSIEFIRCLDDALADFLQQLMEPREVTHRSRCLVQTIAVRSSLILSRLSRLTSVWKLKAILLTASNAWTHALLSSPNAPRVRCGVNGMSSLRCCASGPVYSSSCSLESSAFPSRTRRNRK